MPGPIFQASQGGTYPIKENKEIVANIPLIMRLEEGGKKRIMRQPTLKWPEKGTSTTPQGGSRLDTTPVAGEGEKEKEASTQLQGGSRLDTTPCS
jgi:hypothetical protein